MISITDINELNKILRKYLISQTELPADRVRNALTTYGAELDKLLQRQEYDSINECDNILLFELKTRENDGDVSMTEADDIITFFKSYTLHLILYGAHAATIMNKFIARFRTQSIRQLLYEEGVYIEKVFNDTRINEYKNDVMWDRHDTDIYISCKMSIDQLSADETFESVEPVTTIYKGDENNE